MTEDDWSGKPAIPKIPRPRKPTDDRVQCTGCPDQVPHREIREHSGWPLCLDCHADIAAQADRELTRELAYAA